MQSERALESRHETAKSTARNRKLKSGRRSIASKRQRSIGKQSAGNPWSQSRRRKGRLRWEGFVEKKGNESEGVMDDESGESMAPMEEVPLKELGEPEYAQK